MSSASKPPTVRRYTCLLLGDRMSGKTSFLKRHLTGEFVTEYVPGESAKEYTLWFDTNYGRVEYHVWDTAGLEADWPKPDCVIIMADVGSVHLQLPYWQFTSTPVILCGNKVDLQEKNAEPFDTATLPNKKFQYTEMSVKKSLKIDIPFLWLSRELMGVADLKLACEPAPMPPEHADNNIDAIFALIELKLLEAPDESDDDW
ncbi:hypothetical protein KR222_009496 [Zaprionus bogoriensis]|nr:hypothetical protein KR222_009496 [Zaprionus bogoriensis]